MDLQVLKNITAILTVVGDKPEMIKEVKKDVEEATTFFGNIIADIEKEIAKKEEVAKDKKAGKLFVYPLRVEV